MSLLTSTDELVPLLPVDVAFTFDLIKDHLETAAEDVIIPLITQQVYDKIVAGEYGEEHERLIMNVKRAVANLGYLNYAPWATVRIEDGGVSEKENAARIDTLDSIRLWCMTTAGRAIEKILEYLEMYEADFPEWKESSSYTIYSELPIRTAMQFQKYANIKGSRQTFLALGPAMRRVISFHLKPALGNDLYEELLTSTSAAIKHLNEEYVRPALAHYGIFYGLDEMALTLDDRGILQFNNTSSGKMRTYLAAQQQAVDTLKSNMGKLGETYLGMMVSFLNANASQYPSYHLPTTAGGAVDNDPSQAVIGFY